MATKTGAAHGGWNVVEIELLVDPREIDAFTNIIAGLRRLMTSPGYSMTSSFTGPLYPPLEEQDDVMEDNGIDLTPEDDGEDLRELIERRFDEVDTALRLLVGE